MFFESNTLFFKFNNETFKLQNKILREQFGSSKIVIENLEHTCEADDILNLNSWRLGKKQPPIGWPSPTRPVRTIFGTESSHSNRNSYRRSEFSSSNCHTKSQEMIKVMEYVY